MGARDTSLFQSALGVGELLLHLSSTKTSCPLGSQKTSPEFLYALVLEWDGARTPWHLNLKDGGMFSKDLL